MFSKSLFLFSTLASLVVGASVEYQIGSNSRLAYHLVTPVDLGSHRHELETNNLIRFSQNLSLALGFRAFAEAAYATNSTRYSEPVRTRDSQDFIPRDVYIQYKSGPFTAKLGNQQVAWGEAFGFYYADIVNPKDFRDFGIGPLDRNRLHTPMVNLKWNINDHVIQVLYIPKPYFNKSPSIGSDFAFPFNRFFPNSTVTLEDNRTLSTSLNHGEFGLRLSPYFSGLDLSVLYLSYFDRSPIYVSSNSNGNILVNGTHPKLDTFGITFSAPIPWLVLRGELLYHQNKSFLYFDGNLNAFKSDQFVGVLGADHIVGDKWRIGIQLSENLRDRKVPGAIETSSTQLITGHGSFTFLGDQVFDAILAYAPQDGSSLVELSYSFPIMRRVDLMLGADFFNGGANGQFGLYHGASRGYLQIKTYLGGENKT